MSLPGSASPAHSGIQLDANTWSLRWTATGGHGGTGGRQVLSSSIVAVAHARSAACMRCCARTRAGELRRVERNSDLCCGRSVRACQLGLGSRQQVAGLRRGASKGEQRCRSRSFRFESAAAAAVWRTQQQPLQMAHCGLVCDAPARRQTLACTPGRSTGGCRGSMTACSWPCAEQLPAHGTGWPRRCSPAATRGHGGRGMGAEHVSCQAERAWRGRGQSASPGTNSSVQATWRWGRAPAHTVEQPAMQACLLGKVGNVGLHLEEVSVQVCTSRRGLGWM